jgi:hypothetical protein
VGIDEREVDEFDKLWRLLPHPTGSVVRWFAKKRDERLGDFVRSGKELRECAKRNGSFNFYVQPNPTACTTGIRVSTRDISHWSWFLVDIDPKLGMETPDPKKYLDEVLLWFGEWMGWDFAKDSPLILDSGRGMQAWFRLEDFPFDVETPEFSRGQVRSAMSYWLQTIAHKVGTKYECKLDTTTSDLPRIMRCPGSINKRTGREATIIVEGSPLKGLAHRIVGLAPKEIVYAPELLIPRNTYPYEILAPTLTLRARNFVENGRESPGRHTDVQHLAKCMWEKGACEAVIRNAIAKGNKKSLPEPIDQKEIERILRDTLKEH